jgi:uncharacterized protein
MAIESKYLVDTNVWLERLLDQDQSQLVGEFLEKSDLNTLFISDFSLHSIGVILFRLKQEDLFISFWHDLVINAGISVLKMDESKYGRIKSNAEVYNLDFDDAYQLSISQQYDLTIITFDKDFKKDGILVKSPQELI